MDNLNEKGFGLIKKQQDVINDLSQRAALDKCIIEAQNDIINDLLNTINKQNSIIEKFEKIFGF